jgi:hypothetical protein
MQFSLDRLFDKVKYYYLPEPLYYQKIIVSLKINTIALAIKKNKMQNKNFTSPKASDMYAFATSKNGRTQKWFKDKESLTRFLKSVDEQEYRIVKSKPGSSEGDTE